ncbi:MAG: alpha/beta fold hydrolase, partial [bacterium]
MPLINKSNYRAPLFLQNGHIQSIYPTLFRKFDTGFYERERIFTPDDDFLDLDWSKTGSKKLAIISHGLEGSSHRNYVVGMVKMLNRNGWDALAWNYRSCSGEINRRLRFYNSGTIDDLEVVIQHAVKAESYKEIVLIGFSMGGNLSLLYLGNKGSRVDSKIGKAVVFSVPCDLKASTQELAKFQNKIYMRKFLKTLHQKIRAKMELMPGQINDDDYHLIKNFKDYDNRYTAPLHGFKNAEDYWNKCSSNQFISEIKIPTLIVNA